MFMAVGRGAEKNSGTIAISLQMAIKECVVPALAGTLLVII